MASLYPYLILIGSSIILATVWLLGQARRSARITNELVSLNEKLGFDLPDLLRHCWQPLEKAGFKGISWQLNWFGSSLSKTEGSQGDVFIHRKLDVDDITLSVKLYDGKRRFEQRYFSTVLSESFFLLLYTDMWVKLGTVQGAFAQTAKLSVFLHHDMKNIVQLISLVAEQLENTPAGKEEKLLDSMRSVMPTLQERSERFLSTLSNNAPAGNMEPVDIIEALRTTADIHNLRIDIQGSGQVLINLQSLNSICDNLFGNYIDQNRRNPEIELKIEISIIDTDSDLEISIKDHNGKPCLWPERLFEPFWSEKGDGLGIGLYHARQLVQGAGGTLQAITPENGPMVFVVTFPKSV
ncbi:MAG: hypothetical protein ACI80L_001880 [Pseudohongiellaceae bacterium]|jgi:hypothetical protein